MFNGVSNLTKLIVSDEIRYHGNGTVSDGGKLVFPNPAAKVTDFSEMFTSTKLTKLDLSSFDTSSAKIIYSMFNDNPLLETIYVGDGWDMSNATSYNNMFGNCVKLVGGNGTTFAGSDLKYACVDTEQTPGYLTYKSATT